MGAVSDAVRELQTMGVTVLSPADPTIVGNVGDFLFVASDRFRSVRLVQDRHMEAMRASDFLWLASPDGYVGLSASMEVGFATAASIPVYSTVAPVDLTLRQYVKLVSSIGQAVAESAISERLRSSQTMLINPAASLVEAHRILETLHSTYSHPNLDGETAAETVRLETRRLRDLMSP
jgi:hypothetical protein